MFIKESKYYFPRSTGEEAKVQEGKATCSRPYSKRWSWKHTRQSSACTDHVNGTKLSHGAWSVSEASMRNAQGENGNSSLETRMWNPKDRAMQKVEKERKGKEVFILEKRED